MRENIFCKQMNNVLDDKARNQVANWLFLGVAMIVIQVLLGGVTRLTESGLSITEWKPITGTLPPLNDADWQTEFSKYQGTDQFKYVHHDFSLSDFKFIFFWEWFHRVWARLMGMVFLIGFIYFVVSKKIKKEMISPMVILFLLGGLQGAVGWLMVKSGLVPEKYFVGHIELTVHLIFALLLLTYTLWFALKLKLPARQVVENPFLNKLLIIIAFVCFFQLIYGGFMAGMRAAVMAPTWPDINGYIIPPGMAVMYPFIKNVFYNPVTIHFIHRTLAYLLFALVIFGWFKSSKAILKNRLFSGLWMVTFLLIITQVILGIFTVLHSMYANRLIVLGVSHQFTGLLLVMVITCLLFITKRKAF